MQLKRVGRKEENDFPSASRTHVFYINCLVKDTHLPQIWDKSLTAGQSSLLTIWTQKVL